MSSIEYYIAVFAKMVDLVKSILDDEISDIVSEVETRFGTTDYKLKTAHQLTLSILRSRLVYYVITENGHIILVFTVKPNCVYGYKVVYKKGEELPVYYTDGCVTFKPFKLTKKKLREIRSMIVDVIFA